MIPVLYPEEEEEEEFIKKNRIIHYLLGPHYALFIIFWLIIHIHYKKGHYSLIIIPLPDPLVVDVVCMGCSV